MRWTAAAASVPTGIVIGEVGVVVAVRAPWTVAPEFTTVAAITITTTVTRSVATIRFVGILFHRRSTTTVLIAMVVILLQWLLQWLLLLFLPPHVPIEDAHKIRPKVPDGRSFHRGHFIDRSQGVLFGEHLHLRLDLIILRKFIRGTKSILDEFHEALVDGGCQLVSHRKGGTAGTGPRSAFLDAHVPLDDAEKVGPVVANRSAFDLDGVVVFLECVIYEGDIFEAPKGFQHFSAGLPQDVVTDREWNVGSRWKPILGGPGFVGGRSIRTFRNGLF